MKKKNTSNIFYTLPEQTLKNLVKESSSLSQIFDKLEMCKTGPQYRVLKQRIIELNIDTSHFNQFVKKDGRCERKPITDYLIKDSHIHATSSLKHRLIREGLLKNECSNCHNQGTWDNKPLSLQLDHINGVRNDNRLENLRILCPNCHSQTHTYAGKRHKIHSFCPECGNKKSKKSKICRKCDNKNKIEILKRLPHFQLKDWPNKQELEILIWTKSPRELAKDFNASAKGLSEHCKKLGIKMPPRNYWIRRKFGYSHELALNPPPKKETIPQRVLTQSELSEIRQMLNDKVSCRKIGRKFNVAHTTISAIKRNKTEIYKI